MRRHLRQLVITLVLAGLAGAACASAAMAQTPPAVGSGNVATANPPVPRPHTTPCVVELFPRQAFGRSGNNARMDAAPLRFNYRPPAGCPGPWARVVLEADFAADAGEQYDRTASIWLNGVNLYFGTTQEPSPQVAPDWHVERDLTDYASLLRAPGMGEVLINNWIDATRASVIHAGARLIFYPADAAYPAPRTPDRVYALNGTGTTPAKLDGPGAQLVREITFPRNATRVYVDLFAQPQAHDEFYYMCLPDAVIRKLGAPRSNGSIDREQTCGGGSFREVEVLIDGTPAGLAPVAPWIYTGGLDPFLWQPVPAAETLNFIPYRVDLTPFAGLLADGKPHSVAVTILGHPHFFSLAAAVLVYRDPHAAHTGGTVTRNTLRAAAPQPMVHSTLARAAGGVTGEVSTRARRHFVITGYVDTSAGRVHSSVGGTIDFSNIQQFDAKGARGRPHVVRQTARMDTTSRSTDAHSRVHSLHRAFDYALRVRTVIATGPGQRRQRAVEVSQRFARNLMQRVPGAPAFHASMLDAHVAADRLSYAQGDRESFQSRGQSNMQHFRYTNSLGDCYAAEVQARDRKVIASTHGTGCLDGNAMHWFVHPDGSPDAFGWRGAAWLKDMAGLVLPVPSALIAHATNFLINPRHPQARTHLARGPVEPFWIDERFFK